MTASLPHALASYMRSCYAADKPGAALLVVRQGETLYAEGLGQAKRSFSEAIAVDTNFRMASVTKQFTAMCLHLLEQEGKLSYEEPLLRFFPDFHPAVGKQVTLRHLLTHTSGLLDYEAFVDEKAATQVTDEEVLQIAAARSKTFFEPGTAFRYSNTGFVLLALVVERVSGMSFGEYLRKYIFEPLGMTHSRLYSKNAFIPKRAMGYACDAAGETYFSDQSPCSATKGDGCIYTSLQDYRLWHKALGQPGPFHLAPLLDKVSFPIDAGKGWFYGMGWFFAQRSDGTRELYHTGNTCGFSNLVISLPEQEVLIACFSNLADNPSLLTSLLDTLRSFPNLCPESDLVRHLGTLTR